MKLRTFSTLLLLPLALGLGGCVSAGFMVAGPLFQAAVAIADRSVERTLPADRATSWNATVDALSRTGFRTEEVDRSREEWTLKAIGEKVSVTVSLAPVTAGMSRVTARVEAGGITADKKTADEILNQVSATLTAWALPGSGSSDVSADRKAANEAILSLKREVERLGTRMEQTRDTERQPVIGPTPSRSAVLDNDGILVVPTTAAVSRAPAPPAPVAAPPATDPPAITASSARPAVRSTVPGTVVTAPRAVTAEQDIFPARLRTVEPLSPVEALGSPRNGL